MLTQHISQLQISLMLTQQTKMLTHLYFLIKGKLVDHSSFHNADSASQNNMLTQHISQLFLIKEEIGKSQFPQMLSQQTKIMLTHHIISQLFTPQK